MIGAPTVSVDVGFELATVVQTGRLGSVEDALRTQRAVETALIGTSVRLGLFDNRATLAPAEPLREMMWQWLQSGRAFDRVALVLQSVSHGRRLNVNAMSHHVPVRVFSDVNLARDWLTSSESWPSRSLVVFEDGQLPYAVPAESVARICAWTEPLALPGMRDDSHSLLGDAVLGVVEHDGGMVAVRRPRRAIAATNEPPQRLIVFERDWGGYALAAVRTHVVGLVQLADRPQHDRDVDSTIGLLRYLDPRKLVASP